MSYSEVMLTPTYTLLHTLTAVLQWNFDGKIKEKKMLRYRRDK